MKKLNLQELHDIMMGCAILGTGGGGSLTEGTSVVEKQWNAGKEFKLLDFSEIQDDAYYASPYYCGCMVPEEQEAEEELFDGSDIALSVRELEKYMNTNCQRRYEIVRKRRRNFVVFRRQGGDKIKRFLAQKECSQFTASGA